MIVSIVNAIVDEDNSSDGGCAAGSRLGPFRMVATGKKVEKETDTAQEFWTRPRTTNANWGIRLGFRV